MRSHWRTASSASISPGNEPVSASAAWDTAGERSANQAIKQSSNRTVSQPSNRAIGPSNHQAIGTIGQWA
eukprot:1355468-Prymnesium_polylepis.1